MVSCPHCQTENDADFGLVNCHSCGRPFLIEIDGSVRATDTASGGASVEASLGSSAESFSAPAEQLTNILIEDVSSNSVADFSSEAVESANDIFNLPEEVPAAIAKAARQEIRKETNEDMREVATFGNSDASLAREGGYRFNLSIYGIDSADIREEVKDALTDGRFLWDLESLLNQVEQGVLKLNDLSAVKSALIVQRLKTLPVDIKWEQYAIHQS